VDEVGRGSLAGPVVAAAVILHRSRPVEGLKDSKLLTPARREVLARAVLERAVSVGIGLAGPEEVERDNVLGATIRAMKRAVASLGTAPDHLLIDALRLADLPLPQVSLVKGDRRCVSIAAASVVAKVVRDRVMLHYSIRYPDFDFGSNKGYGTPGHLQALARLGPCPIHRKTFRGVWDQRTLGFGS
jgi:ribonuclease HII